MKQQNKMRSDLLNALNDCIDRIDSGSSIKECVTMYPEFSNELRSLLTVGQTAKQEIVRNVDAIHAKNRVRNRVLHKIYEDRKTSRFIIQTGWRKMLAVFMILFFIGNILYFTEKSLPSQSLYPLKRNLEQVVQTSGYNIELNQRRITEIEQILAARHTSDVQFEGRVESVEIANEYIQLSINGLLVTTSPQTIFSDDQSIGSYVIVIGYTTPYGKLIATSIEVVNNQKGQTLTPSPTINSTLTYTYTATPTPAFTETLTLTYSPTDTTTLTQTIAVSVSPISTELPTTTLLPESTLPPTQILPTQIPPTQILPTQIPPTPEDEDEDEDD